MMRHLLVSSAAAGLLAMTPAGAQTPSSSAVPACPRGVVKIYFASGDITVSPQAQALIGKIGETATSCEPDHIDLVTRFDPAADGDRAVHVALERLSTVVSDLVSRGISVNRIRILAQAVKAGEYPAGHLNQVDVVFRKAGDIAGEPAPTTTPPARTVRSEAI